ncbi:hypothetical protein Daus18300_001577 [Diaporthe australafricana]|uniref:N-acetyltransferase domain-containing protein n=1 Tax=Diaporthe australafricana TaxID=127596 RepID=A0ABR3XVN3_9PEZI
MVDQCPAPSGPAPPHWETIDEPLLEEIYAADQAIYPAPLLTRQRLRSWADACPDFCIRLSRRDPAASETATQGMIIVLPVVEACWERLIVGDLKEHDVDPVGMFPPDRSVGRDSEVRVGLHVFHIERYSSSFARQGGRTPGFAQDALEEVRSRVRDRFPSWSVVGYSALTATPQGNRAFKRVGFTSRYVETKSDGEEAEMLVREGNEAFISL